jgi:hypothetical protein
MGLVDFNFMALLLPTPKKLICCHIARPRDGALYLLACKSVQSRGERTPQAKIDERIVELLAAIARRIETTTNTAISSRARRRSYFMLRLH